MQNLRRFDASGEVPATPSPVNVRDTGCNAAPGLVELAHDRKDSQAECYGVGSAVDGRMVSRVVSHSTGPDLPRFALALPSICPHQTRKRCQSTVITGMLSIGVCAGQRCITSDYDQRPKPSFSFRFNV